MKIFLDPRLFNVLIIFLFACATLRWAFAGDIKQTLYWAGALLCNAAITFLPD